MDRQGNCPQCGSSWDGGSILETFIKQREDGINCWRGMSDKQIEDYVKEFYGGSAGRWSKLIGVELPYNHPKHYDGVSFWKCPDCNSEWDRFTGQLVQTTVKAEMSKRLQA